MSDDKQRRIEAIFIEASELGPGERTALLDVKCADDPDVRREVESLLGHHKKSGGILDADRFPGDALRTTGLLDGGDEPALPQNKRIGSYTILRVLGSGGMGIVYVAEQERPKRTVALKLIRRGLSTPRMIRRFEHEADVLGRLQHPGIAQIYEAGMATIGGDGDRAQKQPFIAMELVDGPTLSKFVSQNKPGTKACIELVIRICDAVQHAHQRGVIHRDLKPGNILVTQDSAAAGVRTTGSSDGTTGFGSRVHQAPASGSSDHPLDSDSLTAFPKVLDFGIARAIDDNLRATTMNTGMGQLIGTLPYMSPEQVAGDGTEIDVRSDVYSIGVILYELLAGRLPHDLKNRSVPEAARIIRDEDPPRLSSFSKVFRGDIETIVFKALEKHRSRRYQSAADLAMDLRRFLLGEPIAARRESTLYTLRRQLMRYRGVALAGATCLLLIVAFAVHAGLSARKERRLKDSALVALQRAKAEAYRADESEEKLAAQLAESNLERGRLLARVGSFRAAEETLWPIFFREPHSIGTLWAMREMYGLRPCLLSVKGQLDQLITVDYDSRNRILVAHPLQGIIVRDPNTGQDLHMIRTDGWSLFAFDSHPTLARVAAYGLKGGPRLYDLDTHSLIWTSSFDTDREGAIAFSPDGSRLACGGRNRQAGVLDAETGEALHSVKLNEAIWGIAWGPRGDIVGITFEDGKIALWHPSSDSSVRYTDSSHTGYVSAIAFSPDGTRLVTAGSDKLVKLWSADTGVCLNTLRDAGERLVDVAYSPDGARIAASGWFNIHVWDALSGKRLYSFAGHEETVRSIAFNRDGSALASVSNDGTMRVWDVRESPGEVTFDTGENGVGFGGFTPDGTRVVTVHEDGRVMVWPTDGGESTAVIDTGVNALDALVLIDDHRAVCGGVGGELIMVNLATATVERRLPAHKDRALSLAVSPDRKRLLSGGKDGKVIFWTLPSLEREGDMNAGSALIGTITFSPDGRSISLSPSSLNNTIKISEAEPTSKPTLSKGFGNVWISVFSPIQDVIALGMWSGAVDIWDLSRNELVRRIRAHEQIVMTLKFSGDGSIMTTGSVDGTVKVFEVAGGRELAAPKSLRGRVTSLDFTSDGRKLLATSEDGLSRVWQLDHFDRHIAGNLEWQIARLTKDGREPAGAQSLREWAKNLK